MHREFAAINARRAHKQQPSPSTHVADARDRNETGAKQSKAGITQHTVCENQPPMASASCSTCRHQRPPR